MPSSTAGAASHRYIHFHPARPNRPFSSNRLVETGAPIAIEIGIAVIKPAMIRPRCTVGNQ